MTITGPDNTAKKRSFETALDLTGFGKYNISMLVACCLLILAMYMDIFGISVVVPAIACDLSLDTSQQGILTAVPLIGVILSSYAWGLAADTIGRRKILIIAMPIGFIIAMAASMVPTYTSICVLKFFSVMFTSAANAAAFVLMGESVPVKNRNRFMFIMASATMFVLCLICSCALPLLKLAFNYKLAWLNLDYRPWRLLLQIISLPGPAGVIGLLLLEESPKFLLSKKRDQEAIDVLQTMYQCNTGNKKNNYSVTLVYLDEAPVVTSAGTSVLRKMWNQTAPLFKPPLLKNSLVLYYLLLCAYMTSTGITMWVPTMTNAFFTGEDSSGRTFCEVASRSANHNATANEKLEFNSGQFFREKFQENTSTIFYTIRGGHNLERDCDTIIKPFTLYAVMVYSGVSTCLTILLSFVVGPLGKKKLTLLVFVVSSICGVLLLFVRIPLLSIALLYMFLYVAQILGNINAYLVDLNPTHLRGMASCLSVVVARGFGFFSVQLIGSLLEYHCTPMIAGYVALVFSGLLVATLLPPDTKLRKTELEDHSTGSTHEICVPGNHAIEIQTKDKA